MLLLLTLVVPSWGQQKPQYSLYPLNNYLLNPAVSGIEQYADVKVGHRNQWVGIEGAPTTSYLSFHTPIGQPGHKVKGNWKRIRKQRQGRPAFKTAAAKGVQPHHGIGGAILSDRIGPFNRTDLQLSYAYHIPFSEKLTISMGFAGGLMQFGLDVDKVHFANPGDNVLGSGYQTNLRPDLSAGIWAYGSKFYLGTAGTQLLRTRLDFGGANLTDQNRLRHHYFLTGGYRFELSPDVSFVPSIMLKFMQPAPLSVDATARFIFRDRMWLGGSYRQGDAVTGFVGFSLNYLLDISYAYDFNTSPLREFSSGTHELLLGIRLRNRGRVLCPQNMW